MQTPGDPRDAPGPALRTIDAIVNTCRGYGVPALHIVVTAVFRVTPSADGVQVASEA